MRGAFFADLPPLTVTANVSLRAIYMGDKYAQQQRRRRRRRGKSWMESEGGEARKEANWRALCGDGSAFRTRGSIISLDPIDRN